MGNLVPPSPKIKQAKMARFGVRAASSLIYRDGDLLFHFTLSKIVVLSPGGIFLGMFGGDVPPGSPNPDPISDQKMSFSTPVFRPDL